MDRNTMLDLLARVASGEVSPGDALEHLKVEPYIRLGAGLCLDSHRVLRTGEGEVVLGLNKSHEQLAASVQGLGAEGRPVLVTRVSATQGEMLLSCFPGGEFWPIPGLFALNRSLPLHPPWPETGALLVVSAGSSDLPVALEALGTALFSKLDAGLVSDVGVAGLHRLLPHLRALQEARLLIVVAGMEGALPSVLAGMTGKPIIAVPTSVGYGTSLSGLAPLLTMLNACATGIAVVNIDNGFGAASMAAKLLAIPTS
jgi:pyridinium-3,5-biscarboxylic acid mononucleotide synthase